MFVAEQLTIAPRQGLGLATVMARKGVGPAAIGAVLGRAMPVRPGWSAGADADIIGIGPRSWLALAENPSPDWGALLRARLADLASVCDQSGGYVIYRLGGPAARTLLQRGAYIDLDPSRFGPGSAATTSIAHIGVNLWQVDEAPLYDIAVFRSFAHSFEAWLNASAAAL